MNAVLINLLYIISSILFIFGIKMLGSAETARRGNRLSSVGMLLAVVATLLYFGLDWWMVAGGIALGSVIGVVASMRVQMTGMPEMVALFNGFGGLASLLVGASEYVKLRDGGMSHYLEAARSAEWRHRARLVRHRRHRPNRPDRWHHLHRQCRRLWQAFRETLRESHALPGPTSSSTLS